MLFILIIKQVERFSLKLKDTTLLITNYKRPQNVLKIIERFKDIMPIEILNNNPAYVISKIFNVKKIYNNKKNRYCFDRWNRARFCKTEYVCLLDDDVLPYIRTILDMRKISRINPNRIIGIYGRNITTSAKNYGELPETWCVSNEVDIAVGACLMFKRDSLCKVYNKYMKPFEGTDRGDDIIASLAFTKNYGEKHLIIDTEVELLPELDVGLNKDKSYHYRRRWEILQDFQRRFFI